MRWDDERYVRLYTRDTPEWTLLSWEARGLFSLLLRAVDRAGILGLGKSGLKGVASLLRMPLNAVQMAMPELIEDGCVVIRGDVLVIRNFIEAQEAVQSDAARKRTERERARDKTRAEQLGLLETCAKDNNPSQNVTDPSRGVTPGHAASQPVTLIRTVPSQPYQDPQTSVLSPPPEPDGSGSLCDTDTQASPTQPPDGAPADEPPTCPAAQEPEEALMATADGSDPVLHPDHPALGPSRASNGQPSLFADFGPEDAPQPAEATAPKPDPAAEVFEHYLAGWRLHIRGNRPPKLDDKRRRLVKARLKEGWLVEELKRACDGLWRSEWHMQEKRIDFDLIMRDTTHIEQFLAKLPPEPRPEAPPLKPPPPRREIQAMMASLAKAPMPSDGPGMIRALLDMAGPTAAGGAP